MSLPRSRRRSGTALAATAALVASGLSVLTGTAAADTTAQALPFSQTWTDISLIAADDTWTGVPGVVGYLGDYSAAAAAVDVDPRTVLTADGTVDVIANQTSPNTLTAGGVAEFATADPVVALQGSGTADAPNLSITVDTRGATGIRVAYDLRDLDGSTDNAAQQVAMQYRVGTTGNFTDVPAGYVADATTGPSLATAVTAVAATLPPPQTASLSCRSGSSRPTRPAVTSGWVSTTSASPPPAWPPRRRRPHRWRTARRPRPA